MKPLFFSAVLFILFVGNTFAQTAEVPQKEFSIAIESNTIEMKANETKKLNVTILKSKSFQKGKVQMSISSTLPAGVTLTFNPDKGSFEISEVTLSTSSETIAGQYSIIISATVNYKTKASILKLIVL